MYFEKIVSDGLAHNSYFIADQGEAVVIDPRRDVDVYLELCRKTGSQLKYVLETHRNEDYVIGSVPLAESLNAEVIHSSGLHFEYGAYAKDGDEFGVGQLKIKVMESPGHTNDSLSYAVFAEPNDQYPFMVFTGDTLFMDDVGRTDLYGADRAKEQAGLLYDSISILKKMGGGVVLYPAHGSGSVCGGQIADRSISSIGFERWHNPMLMLNRVQFIGKKLAEKHLVPKYFQRMEEWNQKGNAPVYDFGPLLEPLTLDEFDRRSQAGELIVDLRMPQAFAGGHVPGSYNVWREGLSSYLPWAVEIGRPFVLILPENADIERISREIFRIGYDEVRGYLRGGFEEWQNAGKPLDYVDAIDIERFLDLKKRKDIQLVDVRKPSEWREDPVSDAHEIFVGDLLENANQLDRERTVITTCSVGHRGSLGASLLKSLGFKKVYNLLGGTTAMKNTGVRFAKGA